MISTLFSITVPFFVITGLLAILILNMNKNLSCDCGHGMICLMYGVLALYLGGFMCSVIGTAKYEIIENPKVVVAKELHDVMAIQVDDYTQIISDSQVIKKITSKDNKIGLRNNYNYFGYKLSSRLELIPVTQ